MNFVKSVSFLLLFLNVLAAGERPNFLIIAIDDLNDYTGCLGGHPNAKTPNLDRIANQGVLFTNAHCNAPVCNPSRASIWTGLRPSTTGIVSNKSGWFRERPGFENVVTLPQAMSREGYSTMAFGKVFHLGHRNKALNEWNQWTTYNYGPLQNPKLNFPSGDKLTDWGVPADKNNEDSASFDHTIANRLIEILGDSHSKPFVLAGGFYRPHTPLYTAQRWVDLHPLATIQLPETIENDNEDLPYFGKKQRREQDVEAPGLWNQEYVEESGNWKRIIQAYLASTTSMDHQLGRVYDALRKSSHSGNTYMIIFSDHGWHLGEKRHWGKAALWEQTTRVPFIILGPGIPKGVKIDKPVELISIYPTVLDYSGGSKDHNLEGHSLRPLLEDPEAHWPHPALTTFVDHHALRTQRWRYIRYVDGSEELYDHDIDHNEFTNLANDKQHLSILKNLRLEMDQLLGK